MNRSKVLSIYGKEEKDYFYQNYDSRIDFKLEAGKPLGTYAKLQVVNHCFSCHETFVGNTPGCRCRGEIPPFIAF